MRDASLKQKFLRGVSLAAVHVAASVSPVRGAVPSLEHGTSGFLARIGLWLRLIFGLGAPRCESVSLPKRTIPRPGANAHSISLALYADFLAWLRGDLCAAPLWPD